MDKQNIAHRSIYTPCPQNESRTRLSLFLSLSLSLFLSLSLSLSLYLSFRDDSCREGIGTVLASFARTALSYASKRPINAHTRFGGKGKKKKIKEKKKKKKQIGKYFVRSRKRSKKIRKDNKRREDACN